jgi:sigma-B regulation protein RsbU (phosphoserine phosphatase)
VGSALLSISILNLLRSQSFGKEKFYDPSAVMTELNCSFQMSQHGGRYFTMWYAVYQRSQRKLVYANAGHPPALVIAGSDRNLQLQQLPSLSMPIGFFDDTEYTSAEVYIEAGTILYVFSDGIFEVMQANNRIWGLPKFIDLLTQELPHNTAISAELVLQSIRRETPDAVFGDDVSLLQINFV